AGGPAGRRAGGPAGRRAENTPGRLPRRRLALPVGVMTGAVAVTPAGYRRAAPPFRDAVRSVLRPGPGSRPHVPWWA
ncbi:hypothetical protein AB0D87_50185, partial [Streptomyces sp. NPDC048342]|uniref:hypothetical protein n=1 Tax=Streptomyces sp. NPDC048342 TaxID=3154716 RepID=UPI00342E7EC6